MIRECGENELGKDWDEGGSDVNNCCCVLNWWWTSWALCKPRVARVSCPKPSDEDNGKVEGGGSKSGVDVGRVGAEEEKRDKEL